MDQLGSYSICQDVPYWGDVSEMKERAFADVIYLVEHVYVVDVLDIL